jgi:predicted small lipoprotein YifL
MTARRRVVALGLALALAGCAQLLPLQRPPLDPSADAEAVSTRDEAIRAFGPPDEVRASDVGQVLVYRRAVVIEANPNRYYGEDEANRRDRYERILLFVDAEGRIVRRAIEPE